MDDFDGFMLDVGRDRGDGSDEDERDDDELLLLPVEGDEIPDEEELSEDPRHRPYESTGLPGLLIDWTARFFQSR